MYGNQAGVDFLFIQCFLLSYVNLVVFILSSNFHKKTKEVCIKTRSTSALHSLEGYGTKPLTVT